MKPRPSTLSVIVALLALAAPGRGDDAGELRVQAERLYDQGSYADAASLNRRALDLASANAAEAVPLMVQEAKLQRALGDDTAAARTAEEALAKAKKDLGAQSEETGDALVELAQAELALGRLAQGEAHAQQAVDLRRRAGEQTASYAEALRVLAELQMDGGDYAAALRTAESALEIERRALGEGSPQIAATLTDLGQIRLHLAALDEAQADFEQALRIREAALGADHPLTAESLTNLGTFLWARGKPAAAQPLLERALAIREKALPADHPSTANTMNNLAEVYRAQGKPDKALPLWTSSLEIYRRRFGANHPRTCAAQANLGAFYWKSGDLEAAGPTLEAAAACWERALGADHPDTAAALDRLAAFYQTAGDDRRALSTYRRGLAADDHNIATVFAVTSEEQKLRFLYRTQGHYYAALSLVRRAFADDEDAVRFGLELVLRHKGIVLDAQARTQEALQGRLSGEALRSWQRLASLRGELSRRGLEGPRGDVEEYRTAIADLQARIEREEEALRRTSPIVAEELAQRDVTVERVAAALGADAALVEYVLVPDWDPERAAWSGRSYYLAFVLTPSGAVRLVDLGESAALEAVIARSLEAVDDKALLASDPVAYDRRSGERLADLYAVILQKVQAVPGTRARLIVSPDGALHRVPFAALRLPQGRYLIESESVSYVSSGRDLLRRAAAASYATDLVMVANPAFDVAVAGRGGRGSERKASSGVRGMTFDSLDGAAEEARVIPPLVPGKHREILGDAKATEAAVHDLKSPRILHFATHGFFLPDENDKSAAAEGATWVRGAQGSAAVTGAGAMVRAGLALAGANRGGGGGGDDGILTALEVSSMDLRGTELVVLSACESAVGVVEVGQGVYGLRRAFVLAGARNLVMSLWPVRDIVALQQMETFYQRFEGGASIPEALRQAQLATIEKLRDSTRSIDGGPISPVRIWAPFIAQQTGP